MKKEMKNMNCLSTSRYMISDEMFKALHYEKLYDSNEIALNKGVFVVTLRVLNKDSNVLVFSYVWYPDIFFMTFAIFLVNKNLDSIRFNEWGDNLVILNKDMFLNDPVFKSTSDNVERLSLNKFDELFVGLGSFYLSSKISNSYGLLKFINKLNCVCNNYEEISDLVELAYNKDYANFVKAVSPTIFESTKKVWEAPLDRNYNLINSLIFVVNDLDLFTKAISDKGFKINKGVKKWRGQINSMGALLSSLDYDYRNSLFNHHQYHINKRNIGPDLYLDRSKFSFRNIHMNIGNIRWYSTKKRTSMESLNTDYINKLESLSKKSFKTDSEVYLYLNNYLSNSPINEETERNIENYLLNFYNHTLSEKKSNSLINFDLFGKLGIKKYIVEAISVINDYLNNFRSKSFVLTKRSSSKTKSSYYLKLILKELNNDVVREMSLGVLARIINGYNKPNDDCIAQNVMSELGDMIIKSYFYFLYRKFIVSNLDSFMVEYIKYLDASHIDVDSKNIIYNYISKLDKNKNVLEVHEIKGLINNILSVNNLSKDKFKYLDFIIEYTLSDWKLDNKDIVNLYDNNLLFGMAGIIIDWLKESNLIQENLVVVGRKERHTYIIPSDNIIEILKQNNIKSISSLPLRIPMIVKPKRYSRDIINNVTKERLGGYLINDEKVTDTLIIPNWELKEASKIKDDNIVYDLVNNLNSVGYKINKEVMDFIYLHADEYKLLTPLNLDLIPYKSKMLKKKFTELESHISKLYLQENILGLAEIYSKIHSFFLPVRIDYRGRVNCISQYLNYQSNELAKSLLLFSKGEKLMKNDNIGIGYLKAYGANCFGNKLDKKSWVDRIKWVDENESDIVNYNNGKLIKEAENKLLFIAFCIEYKKWVEVRDNIEASYFMTHLPIQLDATCNGFQHLCLLVLDMTMGMELNLTESSMEDLPKDFYGFVMMKLDEYFKNQLEINNLSNDDKECYIRLSKALITRKTVKKTIMTIPYNISVIQMIANLKEHFINISEEYTKTWSPYNLVYQYKEDPSIVLCEKDLILITTSLRTVLFKNFPKLKELVGYLRTVARIFYKLNLPIVWGTTSGILVNQYYMKSNSIKLRPFSYDKSSFTLKIPTNQIYYDKQVRAFMPNLIHSLDATALALLVKYLFNEENGVNNFYAIHDCFAVTANNVDSLIKYLKLVYIKMYSQDSYLKNLNEQLIKEIKYAYGEDCFDNETREIKVIINNIEIKETFPDINFVLGTKLPEGENNSKHIERSSYILN